MKNCSPFSSLSDTRAVYLEFKKNIASISELFKLEKLNSDQQDELRNKLTNISLNFKPIELKNLSQSSSYDYEKECLKIKYVYNDKNKLVDIEVL